MPMADDGKHDERGPFCRVTPIPSIGGERRTYRGFVQPFASHAHEHYVIGRIEEGERILELNGTTLQVGPGDLMAFNPGDVHGCRHASEELLAYDSVTVAARILDGARLRFPKHGDAIASAAYDDLLVALDANDREETLERVLYLASLLESSISAPTLSATHEASALRAHAHLREHLTEPASVADLAAMEGISEYALIRAYRKRFSITPLQHLMSMRIEHARELLANGVAPIDTAAATGFADQAHLTRIFKQRIGTTPAAYRKMIEQNGDGS